jgi:hypothetical protein
MIEFVQNVPAELLLQEGLPPEISLYIQRVVEAQNRHCNRVVEVSCRGTTFSELPLFRNYAQLVRLIRNREPLVLSRRCVGRVVMDIGDYQHPFVMGCQT